MSGFPGLGFTAMLLSGILSLPLVAILVSAAGSRHASAASEEANVPLE
jgi:hypothetical protein